MKKGKTNSTEKRVPVFYGHVLPSNLLEQNKNNNNGFILGYPGKGKSFHNRIKTNSEQ